MLLSLACPLSAFAQTENRFAIGGDFTTRTPGDSSAAGGSKSVGITWRFGHSDEGWGWDYGMGWYSTDVDRPIGGQSTALGELKIRPFMGGYGYTHIIGRAAITASVLGGYAFASIEQSPGLSDAIRDRLGGRTVQAEAANTFVTRPQIGMWYDVSKKVGLHLTAAYTVARPQLTVNSSLGADERRLHADMFAVNIGLVYSIF